MKHYDPSQWADFVRGLGSAIERANMHRHLETGCRRCARRLATFEQVAAVTRRDAAEPVPEHALRTVRAAFDLHRPAASTLTEVVLETLFDSALAPAAGGVRSSGAGGRQLLLRSADYTLELQVERPTEADIQVAGRVLGRPAEPVIEAPAFLLSGEEVTARAVTDETGGFSLRSRSRGGLELQVHPREGQRLRVDLGSGTR